MNLPKQTNHVKNSTGYPAGYTKNGVFIKKVWERNVLRYPEPSLTIDVELYNTLRPTFNIVRIIMRETKATYELPATTFDELAETYDYGYGKSYRVPITAWKLTEYQPILPGVCDA